MAIEAPKWVARMGAYPTKDGWTVNRAKGRTEVVKRRKFTATEIAEWHAAKGAPVAPAPAPAPEPVIQTLHEAPVQEQELTESEVEYHYGQEDVTEEPEE